MNAGSKYAMPEKVCVVCGKRFVVMDASQWKYKKKRNSLYCCSYRCHLVAIDRKWKMGESYGINAEITGDATEPEGT